MGRTAVVIDRDYLKHDPGAFHPERPERLKTLLDLSAGLDTAKFQLLPPKAARRMDIEACHDSVYIELVESTSSKNQYALDGDTITCRDSFGVGVLAVGGFVGLLDAVAARECSNGFALVRPPGHHALKGRAMGFCLFNTVAIGAHYLKRNYGAKRVLIMDWDVHHGNGTQDAFYDDPSVLYISTHQYPYYPGTGAVEEAGVGAGKGFTINVPLPAGCADAEYLRAFQDIVVPAVDRFQPDWILVSAGFDPHRRDPLGGMGVTDDGFAVMAQRLLQLAEKHSGGRIAFLLEGGYDLTALKNSVAAVLEEMAEASKVHRPIPSGGDKIQSLIHRIKHVHHL